MAIGRSEATNGNWKKVKLPAMEKGKSEATNGKGKK